VVDRDGRLVLPSQTSNDGGDGGDRFDPEGPINPHRR